MTFPHGVATDLVGSGEEYLNRLHEIRRLIELHLRFSFIEEMHRPVSVPEATFPAFFVDADRWKPQKDTVGKYKLVGWADIYIYETDNSPIGVRNKLLSDAAIVEKLFSDNALNDLFSGSPTRAFLVNPGFWVDSEMEDFIFSKHSTFQKDSSTFYIRGVNLKYRFEDWIIH